MAVPGRVIRTEKVELESDRVALIEAVMENKRKTKALEDDLLYRLTSTQVGPRSGVLVSAQLMRQWSFGHCRTR